MAEELFRQCELQKRGGDTQVVWIPVTFAHVGKVVKVKMEDGTWSDGWKVTQTYSTRTRTEALAAESDHKKQRKASDI
jgi:hypothetical protein